MHGLKFMEKIQLFESFIILDANIPKKNILEIATVS